MTPHENLIAAKALIPDEEHWWRGAEPQPPNCHCPYTAINFTFREREGGYKAQATQWFAYAIGGGAIGSWNDSPRRTLAEVHAAFDAAIEATRP